MRTHIAPIYLILGLMAVSALAIGAGNPQPSGGEIATRVKLLPSRDLVPHRVGADARAFQATSPGMAMPGRLVVLVSDAALAEARARRKAG